MLQHSLAVRFSKETDQRLDHLAKVTGRTKAYYIRKAVEDALEDLEDIHIAVHRLENPPQKYLTTEELLRSLDIDVED